MGPKVDVRPQIYGDGARDVSDRRRWAGAEGLAQGEGAEACGGRAEGGAGNRGSLARQRLDDHLPVQHVVVQRAYGQTLVEAVGANVERRNAPAAVDVVNWDALRAE